MVKTDGSLAFTPPTLAGQKLSNAERRIFDYMTQGLSCAEIAYQLFVTESSVRSQQSAIYRKCGVRGQIELLGILLRQEREAQELLVAGIAIVGEVA
jgi:DNA-binding NarL/FixJ family response regulator